MERNVDVGKAAILAFIRDFQDAPNDADIEIRTGSPATGGPCYVVVTLSGKNTAFLPDDADKLALIMDDAMRRFPSEPAAMTLPNIIMGLRQGAAVARATP